MLGLIRRALARRKLGKRELFVYSDGTQTRRGDPFLIFRSIFNDPRIDLYRDKDLIDLGAEPETTKAVEVLSDAFGVTRWDGQRGLTDWELLALLKEFTAYMEALKKNGNPSSTLSPTMDSKSSTSPACPPAATNYCAQSTPTSDEANCADPFETSTPSEQELHSH